MWLVFKWHTYDRCSLRALRLDRVWRLSGVFVTPTFARSGNEVFRGPGCALRGWCLSGTPSLQCASSAIGQNLAFKWCFCHTDICMIW